MKKAIIGKKVGMTQIFDEMGKVIPKRKATMPSSSALKKSATRSFPSRSRAT